MNSRTLAAIALVAVAAGAWFLLRGDFDEEQIRRNLDDLAAMASSPEGQPDAPAPLVRLARIRKVLTEDCEVRPGEAYPAISGRDNLMAVIGQYTGSVSGLRVTFHDLTVTVADDGQTATTTKTVTVTSRGKQGEDILDAREARMTWRKVDGDWRIAVIEEVATLR